jgi:hypothetical protein
LDNVIPSRIGDSSKTEFVEVSPILGIARIKEMLGSDVGIKPIGNGSCHVRALLDARWPRAQ